MGWIVGSTVHGKVPAEQNRLKGGSYGDSLAIGRNNWLFAGSLRAGKRAAAVMSLVHSARLNGPSRQAKVEASQRIRSARQLCDDHAPSQ